MDGSESGWDKGKHMKRKFGLQMKFALLFFGVMTLITVSVLYFTGRMNEMIIDEKYHNYAVSIARLAASMVTAEEIERYKTERLQDQAYERTLQELQRIQRQTDIQYLYIIAPLSDTEGMYIFDALYEETEGESGDVIHRLGDIVSLDENYEEAKWVVENGKMSRQFEYEDEIEDGNVEIASAYAPILTEDGICVAFVGVDIDIEILKEGVLEARNYMMGTMLFLMAGFFILLVLVVRISVLTPIRRLKHYAENMMDGVYGKELPVRGHDELSEITDVFNRMSKSIQGHMDEIKVINRAYQNYVPSELLSVLGKDSITQMELGSQTDELATILAVKWMGEKKGAVRADSRSILASMNLWLQNTIPKIMEYGGFVKDFQDTEMLAVYTNETENAVLSAISIIQNLAGQQGQTGKSEEISIGITHGTVLFGVVGYETRMAAVAISAHTSMARSLQKLAPHYGSKLLITASAAMQITDFFKTYHVRFIGMIENKYTHMVEKIYDIFDGDSIEQREGKQRTKEKFETGVELFCMRKFRESRQSFVAVLKNVRNDAAAKRYLKICNQYYQCEHPESVPVFMYER